MFVPYFFRCWQPGFPLYRFCSVPVFVTNPCASCGRSRLVTNTRSELQQGAAAIPARKTVILLRRRCKMWVARAK